VRVGDIDHVQYDLYQRRTGVADWLRQLAPGRCHGNVVVRTNHVDDRRNVLAWRRRGIVRSQTAHHLTTGKYDICRETGTT